MRDWDKRPGMPSYNILPLCLTEKRPPCHPHVGIAQNTTTPRELATLKTNMKESDKTPHKDLADIGFSGYCGDYGQDEFPPIETVSVDFQLTLY